MTDNLRQEIDRHLLQFAGMRLGIAVSGGGDSIALMHLVAEFAKKHPNTEVLCVTVDHGLRPDARDEAKAVASACSALGVAHTTLRWQGWDGSGNTQNEARKSRYRLIADWAREKGVACVLLGHTSDDQAETFLMRLARSSGVDGLSCMSARRFSHDVLWMRPLLDISRENLREYLRVAGESWIEDPSNDDARFERVKARRTLMALKDLGIDAEVLSDVASHMQQAREALSFQCRRIADQFVSLQAGALCIRWTSMENEPEEIRRRLLIGALGWINGNEYPPRRNALKAAVAGFEGDGAATLEGCLLRRKGEDIWVSREYNSIRKLRTPLGEVWDGRWLCNGGDGMQGLEVAALGAEGLSHCAEWRNAKVPRDVLMVSPAIWQGKRLIAAPLVEPSASWQVDIVREMPSF